MPFLVAALIVGFTVYIRLHFLSMPFERDEGEYAYVGQIILKGMIPYKDAYNMKLPGTYYLYALIEAMLGQTDIAIRVALLIINLVSGFFVFLIAMEFLPSVFAFSAASFFCLLSVSPAALGITANAEHFVLLFALPGIYLLLRTLRTNSVFTLLCSGFLLGLSFLMKQHAVFINCMAIVYLVISYLRVKKEL